MIKKGKEFLKAILGIGFLFVSMDFIIDKICTIALLNLVGVILWVATYFMITVGVLTLLKEKNIVQVPFISTSISVNALSSFFAYWLVVISDNFLDGSDFIRWISHVIIWWDDKIIIPMFLPVFTFACYGIFHIAYHEIKEGTKKKQVLLKVVIKYISIGFIVFGVISIQIALLVSIIRNMTLSISN